MTAAIMLAGTLIPSERGEATLGVVDLTDMLWRKLAVAALLGAVGVGVGHWCATRSSSSRGCSSSACC